MFLFVTTIIFVASCVLIVFGGNWVVSSISSIARFLRMKEFVVAFFALSLGAVAPEFFIGLTAALHGVPELSLGNIIGQNILLLSLAVALSAFFLKGGIKVESRTVRTGSIFAIVASIMPLLLIMNGELSRIDGTVLILTFVIFTAWLFSEKERFSKVYQSGEVEIKKIGDLKKFFKNALILIGGLVLIVLSAEGIIRSSLNFSEIFLLSIPFVGLIVVAIGTGLPETYVAVRLARHGQSWMILGGLMGAVAMSSTLVLGIVALINPIVLNVAELPHLALARVFLLVCALFFLLFIRTGRVLSNREATTLLSLYILFLVLSFLIARGGNIDFIF